MRDFIRVGYVALVLSLSLAGPVAAGPFNDGVAAYKRGDYATALRLWRPLADQGDADAQANLGSMYDNGEGVPRDYMSAHKCFNLAAAHFPASETEGREKAVINRDRVAGKMNAAQVVEAQRLAREWKPK